MAGDIIRELEVLKDFVKYQTAWNGAERKGEKIHKEDERNEKEKRFEGGETGKNILIE